MRTLFITDNAGDAAAVRERVHGEAQKSGRLPPDARAEDWTLIGEAGYVRDQVAMYRERLGVTHLIVTRLRIGGVERARLEASAARAFELLG